ncbi:MAG: hypothetical protein EU543_02065 [Promethearchaeota archaeon]|nr:MAG: hypothetical protein EU543_02065 [Candidatus Lokiarchaeota archaeon]
MEKNKENRESRKLFFRKGHSETFHHLLFKFLAYCYFWDEPRELIIEPNYRFKGYKPDLLQLIPSEIPRRLRKDVGIWVECKDVAIKKLLKLAKTLHRSHIYWFHLDHYFERLLANPKILKKFDSQTNLKLIGIDMTYQEYDFLAYQMGDNNLEWFIQRDEETLIIIDRTWKKEIEFCTKL